MGLKLHGIPISTCTTKVMTCLHEKEVDFELITVDLMNNEHKKPPFLSMNPFGQIPVLQDGDLTIFESRAITSYVAEKYKEQGYDLLRKKDPKEAAIVKVWAEVEAQQFYPAVSEIIYKYFTASVQGKEPDQALINSNLEKLTNVLDVYEKRLSGNKYIAGDFFSIADLHHLSYIFYFLKTPWASLINDRPFVKSWWETISSRPSFKKVSESMTFGYK